MAEIVMHQGRPYAAGPWLNEWPADLPDGSVWQLQGLNLVWETDEDGEIVNEHGMGIGPALFQRIGKPARRLYPLPVDPPAGWEWDGEWQGTQPDTGWWSVVHAGNVAVLARVTGALPWWQDGDLCRPVRRVTRSIGMVSIGDAAPADALERLLDDTPPVRDRLESCPLPLAGLAIDCSDRPTGDAGILVAGVSGCQEPPVDGYVETHAPRPPVNVLREWRDTIDSQDREIERLRRRVAELEAETHEVYDNTDFITNALALGLEAQRERDALRAELESLHAGVLQAANAQPDADPVQIVALLRKKFVDLVAAYDRLQQPAEMDRLRAERDRAVVALQQSGEWRRRYDGLVKACRAALGGYAGHGTGGIVGDIRRLVRELRDAAGWVKRAEHAEKELARLRRRSVIVKCLSLALAGRPG